MASPTSGACDACRLRRVKCNRAKPCAQCAHLNLACVFSPALSKRKPGVRGRLIAQLRQGRKHEPLTTQTRGTQEAESLSEPSVSEVHDEYTDDFFLDLMPEYESHVFPVHPIITPNEMRVVVRNMHRSHEDAALAYAYAATTINLTRTSWDIHEDIAAQMIDLMQRSIMSYRETDSSIAEEDGSVKELPVDIKRIMTCIFLEIPTMGFRRFKRSLLYLREAVTMIQTLNIHQYNGGGQDSAYVACCQRLYWEAFIHERFMNIAAGYPATLPALSTGMPIPDSTLPANVDMGFTCLIRMFTIMDDTFLDHWNAQQDPARKPTEMKAQWIESKQIALDRDEHFTAEADRALMESGRGGFSELQHADLFITRLWLRILVWQLALFRGLLRSAPADNSHEGLSLHFPVQRLSAQLRSLVTRLNSFASIATHGSGIIQKLFEITSTIADVLALPQGGGQSHEAAQARMEDFAFLVKFMFSFQRIQKEQRAYLRDKIEILEPMYKMVDLGALAGASPT